MEGSPKLFGFLVVSSIFPPPAVGSFPPAFSASRPCSSASCEGDSSSSCSPENAKTRQPMANTSATGMFFLFNGRGSPFQLYQAKRSFLENWGKCVRLKKDTHVREYYRMLHPAVLFVWWSLCNVFESCRHYLMLNIRGSMSACNFQFICCALLACWLAVTISLMEATICNPNE